MIPVRLRSNIHELDSDLYWLDIEYRNISGDTKRLLLPRSVSQHFQKACDALSDLGVDTLGAPRDVFRRHVANSLQVRKPVRQAVRRTGWRFFGGHHVFILPEHRKGDPVGPRLFRLDGSLAGRLPALHHSVDEWSKAWEAPCASSSYLTFALCLGLAAPLLDLVKLGEAAAFHLSGESSTGKSLVCVAARSTSFRSVLRSNLPTPDTTDRGLEELFAGYNDLVTILDDTGRIPHAEWEKFLRRLAYKGPAGTGRQLSKKAQDSGLPMQSWRTLILVTGEKPLSTGSSGARAEGEQLRLIDITVPSSSRGGIFDGKWHAKPRRVTNEVARQLAAKAERAVRKYHSAALREFVRRVAADRPKAASRAKDLVNQYVAKSSGQGSWEKRLAEKFALIYAAGVLAVDFDMAPWMAKQVYFQIRRLHRRALKALLAGPQEALGRLQAMAQDKKAFPVIAAGKSVPDEVAHRGFWKVDQTGKRFLALPSETLAKAAGGYAGAVLDALDKGGHLWVGKKGSKAAQVKVSGQSRKRSYFRLHASFLKANLA